MNISLRNSLFHRFYCILSCQQSAPPLLHISDSKSSAPRVGTLSPGTYARILTEMPRDQFSRWWCSRSIRTFFSPTWDTIDIVSTSFFSLLRRWKKPAGERSRHAPHAPCIFVMRLHQRDSSKIFDDFWKPVFLEIAADARRSSPLGREPLVFVNCRLGT